MMFGTLPLLLQEPPRRVETFKFAFDCMNPNKLLRLFETELTGAFLRPLSPASAWTWPTGFSISLT